MAALDIRETEITRDGFIILIKNINHFSLQLLRISRAHLHYQPTLTEGFNYTAYEVLASTYFPQMIQFNIYDSGLDERAAEILSRWRVPNLRVLFIQSNPLGDRGVQLLANRKNCPKLQYLNIRTHGLI